MEVSRTLIDKIYGDFCDNIHFAKPLPSSRTNEADLVRGVLHILQGSSSSLFYWDEVGPRFCVNSRLYVNHLSPTSLNVLLSQFLYSATCLKLVEITVCKMESSLKFTPTLRAFACAVSVWLKRLRGIALKEEEKIHDTNIGTTLTLLELAISLSSLCSGAEYLLQLVNGAIRKEFLEPDSSVLASEMAVHVLDHLYKKLNEVSLVQGGEEEAYLMILYIFVGSLLPYIEALDCWLYEGTLDDPFEEVFFYSNKENSIDDAEFWEKSYLLRPRQSEKFVFAVCPFFIRDVSKSIVSAGKSLQLIRHVSNMFPVPFSRVVNMANDGFGSSNHGRTLSEINQGQSITGLTLSELFCISLAGLIGYGDQIFEHFSRDPNSLFSDSTCLEKTWYKFFVDTLSSKREKDSKSYCNETNSLSEIKEEKELHFFKSFCPENPAITVCQSSLIEKKDVWSSLNLSQNYLLPPLNDGVLRDSIFGGKVGSSFMDKGTDYAFGFNYDESDLHSSVDETRMLETLFPFPTLLPSFQENLNLSELLPFQNNSTLPSRVLRWILSVEPKVTPLPGIIMQECLVVYIKKQVDFIGKQILSKLMNGWRLMDELGVLRAIYLLGSGDLLQHFLTVVFNKLDKGASWDDDFELNIILQESIGNSADSMLLCSPESLVVSISKNHSSSGDMQPNAASFGSIPRKSQEQRIGIDGLDLLEFTYKVPWPLELIANKEAIKKYNQVMHFLLKVKRAKFVLDKARRWMWKDKGTATISRKQHWLVEQKLLHFVDAFHQYVMDRVYHSAWLELCQGMSKAGSLDEVIEVHEAYLLSIQRQCFVVPDKLWALIASRINSILGLALDFYTIQQTLNSGGAISAVKARCEIEIDRIDKQFDDCIAFLLRVLSFKLNVGHFPHLADLVTRINYNYFYMSESGNLVTTPVTSRRTD